MFSAGPDLPEHFRYRSAFLHGPPVHGESDAFRARHPAMSRAQRAKIFAPFDALKGFSDGIAAKEAVYEPFRELSEEQAERLNRLLSLLRRRIAAGRPALVGVEYFQPCEDPDSEAWGLLGQYRTCAGALKAVDPVRGLLVLEDRALEMDLVYDIRVLSGPSGETEAGTETEEEDGGCP